MRYLTIASPKMTYLLELSRIPESILSALDLSCNAPDQVMDHMYLLDIQEFSWNLRRTPDCESASEAFGESRNDGILRSQAAFHVWEGSSIIHNAG